MAKLMPMDAGDLNERDVVVLLEEDDALFSRAVAALRDEVKRFRQMGRNSTVVLEFQMCGGLLDRWRIKYDSMGEDRNLKSRIG